MSAHPRISLNSLSSLYQSLADDVTMWRDLEVDHVGLISPKLEITGWDAARAMVADAHVKVSNVSIEQKAIAESIELAAAIGAPTVYFCSGPLGARPWEAAADALVEWVGPHLERANQLGVRLAVEPTNPLRGDVSFVFCLRDAIDLARAAGIGVVLDFYSCWYERGLEELVRKNIELLTLVQICDYAFGTFDTPNRVAIGDGDIPVERLLGMILDAGYGGAFDLEILGPRIEAEGYVPPIRRSLERATEILTRLGA